MRKRIVSFVLAAIMMVAPMPVSSAASPPYPPNTLPINAINGIDYSNQGADTIIIPSTRVYADGTVVLVGGNPISGEFNIILDRKEDTFVTTTASFSIKAYSFDGGETWINCSKQDDNAFKNPKFSTQLDKYTKLWVSNQYVEKSTGKPPSTATFVNFPTINKRPIAPKLVVNYAFNGVRWANPGASPFLTPWLGEWALTEDPTINSIAVRDDILIGTENYLKETIEGMNFLFGKFPASGGIPVEPMSNGKSFSRTYFIKTVPKEEKDGSYTPASKVKKLSVSSQIKASKYKADKRGDIKLKVGKTAYYLVDVYGNASLGVVGLGNTKLNKNNFQTVWLWLCETPKKPASEMKTIN